jgi:pseudouridine-5'-phosphate glycosidase
MTAQPSKEVRAALEGHGPVVALESTLITHGLPYPDNLEVAHEAEDAVRQNGAVPATIAVLDGRVRLGLAPRELERLARPHDEVHKLSLRDLGPAVARAVTGGTTVAATARIAARAGIEVFATGGLGGVHHGARDSWDVSADLLALRDAPMVVVCSGIKSILDLPATLEVLESASVALASYRQDDLPGFLAASAAVPAPWRFDRPEDVATAYHAGRALGFSGALVLCHAPDASLALELRELDDLLASARDDASGAAIGGKEVTPYLLAALNRASGGRTLAVNKDLVVRNAALAARVACALARGAGEG